VTSHPDGALLTVWVVPGAKRSEVVGYHGDTLRIRVAAPPEKGRANKALVTMLEEAIGARVRLASGTGSRRKRIVVLGVTPDDLVLRLSRVGN
jgi:uncharacterized protein (TIGR00251 family)